jgi:hypothetical protein
MRPELGEFIPHGLAHWVVVAWQSAACGKDWIVTHQSARHRVDHGTICGRSCANSGHCKPLCACVDRTKFVASASVAGPNFFSGGIGCRPRAAISFFMILLQGRCASRQLPYEVNVSVNWKRVSLNYAHYPSVQPLQVARIVSLSRGCDRLAGDCGLGLDLCRKDQVQSDPHEASERPTNHEGLFLRSRCRRTPKGATNTKGSEVSASETL